MRLLRASLIASLILPALLCGAEQKVEILALNDGRRLVGIYDEARGILKTIDSKTVTVPLDDISWRAPAPARAQKIEAIEAEPKSPPAKSETPPSDKRR